MLIKGRLYIAIDAQAPTMHTRNTSVVQGNWHVCKVIQLKDNLLLIGAPTVAMPSFEALSEVLISAPIIFPRSFPRTSLCGDPSILRSSKTSWLEENRQKKASLQRASHRRSGDIFVAGVAHGRLWQPRPLCDHPEKATKSKYAPHLPTSG